jgi:hypothetical protein
VTCSLKEGIVSYFRNWTNAENIVRELGMIDESVLVDPKTDWHWERFKDSRPGVDKRKPKHLSRRTNRRPLCPGDAAETYTIDDWTGLDQSRFRKHSLRQKFAKRQANKAVRRELPIETCDDGPEPSSPEYVGIDYQASFRDERWYYQDFVLGSYESYTGHTGLAEHDLIVGRVLSYCGEFLSCVRHRITWEDVYIGFNDDDCRGWIAVKGQAWLDGVRC